MTDLKKCLQSPTSSVRMPTFHFQSKRSTPSLYSVTFIFFLCTAVIIVLGNSHINQSSDWIKNILKNRELAYAKKINHPGSNAGNLNSDVKNFSFRNSSDNNNNVGGSQDFRSVTNGTSDHGVQGNYYNSGSFNTTVFSKGKRKTHNAKSKAKKVKEKLWVEMMSKCDIFDGKWVKDESPPLYERGSCPHIDEPFNCYENGRPDNAYENFRWQPNHCNLPRLDGGRMLRFLKGKRIVYVGDSLNRNMWQSMVCLLRNSVEDKNRVFEASGRTEFKKEGAYSFLFPDHNCSVEYIRSAFLVQESEVPGVNGSKKETLRLDLVENSYDTYKDADVLVFNTGHWWTHEKTSQGRGYYQEGEHVHEKMEVTEAFHKAIITWAKWMEDNINPKKTHVFFRGYSLSHFSEGEWNSGGKCDDSTEPVNDEKDLMHLSQLNPPIPQMIEKSLSKVKFPVPVFYLNVTEMTNYRRDAHPSIYRKPNITEEEKTLFRKNQDCSHWCLPGVPDIWNQLLFAKLLLKHKQTQLEH